MTSFKPIPELAGPLYGKHPWPLRFHRHGFHAVCFNSLYCSIIYNGHQFGTRQYEYDGTPIDKPSGPPPFESWRDQWTGSHSISPVRGKTFTSTVDIEWGSLDGRRHGTSIDLDVLFKERLILHKVGRDEVKEAWLATTSLSPVSPDLLVEVNDAVVNVYMRAIVATEAEQIPGNSHSHFRDDIILAWTRTY
ncbi:MAG TPA: hypothetical protein VM621_12535 [Luteibacter sp.]|uniref:hypothetical protein n=1 Tax=Luteibacter sp. TaxID=1886636 RepID=UPI002BD69419|nr:hypothetical protein [Luteibacter sp.]HVI55862.1 hypothetical protein [Luteibacter sp.]